MTRCAIAVAMAAYALLRLVLIAVGCYTGDIPMPMSVYIISGAVCIVLIAVGIAALLGRVGALGVRSALFCAALGAAVNIYLVFSSPVSGGADTVDLIIAGTFFDILAFLFSFLIKIRRGNAVCLTEMARNVRAARQARTARAAAGR